MKKASNKETSKKQPFRMRPRLVRHSLPRPVRVSSYFEGLGGEDASEGIFCWRVRQQTLTLQVASCLLY